MTATPAEIQRLIECSMCCDYLNDVRETPCCHQLVCLQCIRSWLEKPTKNCPKCRSTTLVETNLLKNYVIQRFVDQLQFSCPNQLQGCQVKMIKADLNKHLRFCEFSPMKLAEKQRLKLQERRSLLLKFKEGKTEISDNVLYDLAKTFLTEREFQTGKECLEMIKDKKKLHIQDVVILQAQIERDSGQFDKALEFYTKAYGQARSVPQRIDLLAIIGELYLKKAQYERADDVLRQALDLLPSDDTSEKKVELLNNLGLVAKKCSDYDQAIEFYTEAMRIVDSESKLWADITANLADIHRKKGNYNEAKDLYLKSLKQAESLFGENHPSVAEIRNNLGVLLKKEGHYDEALENLKQALKIFKHYYGNEHPSIGICLTNVGDIYRKQGDFKTAETTYDEALTYLERAYGPDHIEVAEVLNSMGLIRKKQADYDEAELFYQRAIEIVYKTFGREQEHYKLGIFYNNLADLDRKRNRFDKALELYRKALISIEKTLGQQHSEAGEILHNIGQVEHQLGHYREAIDYINRALIIIKKEFGDKHYKYGMFLNSLGLSFSMTGDYGMAFVYLKQALQILQMNLGNDHIEVADVYMNLGDVSLKYVIELDGMKVKKQIEQQTKLEETKKYFLEAQRIIQLTFGNEHTKAQQILSLIYIVNQFSMFQSD